MRQLSSALVTLRSASVRYPPLWIVLAGGAGEEGRLARTRAHDKEDLTNPAEHARSHDPRSLVAGARFRKNFGSQPPAIAGSRITELSSTRVFSPSRVRTSSPPT